MSTEGPHVSRNPEPQPQDYRAAYAEGPATDHRPECWCNGTGWRVDLGVPCNLPQLTTAEAAFAAEGPATVTHQFQWHPVGVAEQVAGRNSSGSASCSCGDWKCVVLDNRAGRASAKQAHSDHAVAALTADLATARADIDHWKAHAEEAGAGFTQVCRDAARISARNVELRRVIANVRALADRYDSRNSSWVANTWNTIADDLRALLPAAPTGDQS